MRHGETDLSSNDVAEEAANYDQALVNLARAITVGEGGSSWRDYCLNGRKTFPAGVTYLSQLMAHDLTHSAKLDCDISQASRSRNSGRHVNLRKNQLLLDTLYGEGPVSDPQLFDGGQVGIGKIGYEFNLLAMKRSNTGLIKTVPSFSASVPWQTLQPRCHPKFGDIRNADNPIIMRMTTLLMMYHNLMMNRSTERDIHEKFLEARIKTTLAWHRIIRNDIIDRVCLVLRNNEFDKKLTKELNRKPDAVEADFLHGLLRSFHCLTIPQYRLGYSKKAIEGILDLDAVCPIVSPASHPEQIEIFQKIGRWQNLWDIDLDHFFSESSENRTAFTPSYAFKFDKTKREASKLILLRDQLSGKKQGVSKITSPLYRHLIPKCSKMLSELRHQLAIPDEVPLPDANEIPLHLAFLAESHFDSKKIGTLGRTGSVFFNRIVESKIRSAQRLLNQHKDKATIKEWYSDAPKSFCKLAYLVAPNDVRKFKEFETS